MSNLERAFLLEALSSGKRVDGRAVDERRSLAIHFGSDLGSSIAILGETRVTAQVSCSVVEPRTSRPNEGLLSVYVETLGMASQRFTNKSYGSVEDEVTELTRLMERCLKESRCLDLESLCIISEEKVWNVRLDLRVLNDEGNLFDCCSVAGLAALAHFKRPDVTLDGDKVTIHPVNERDPVKLAVHHYPVCTTFAFFNCQGHKIILSDPNHKEESVMDGKLVLGINPYKEICTLHLASKMLIDKDIVLKLAHAGAEQAKDMVNIIKNALLRDEDDRKTGQVGFAYSLRKNTINTNEVDSKEIDLDKLTGGNKRKTEEDEEEDVNVSDVGNGVVEMTDELEKKEELASKEEQSDSEEETVTLSGKDLNK